MVDGQTIAILLVGIIIGIAIFVALREFWCWYWKINEIRNLLRQILHRLEASPRDPGTKDGESLRQGSIPGKDLYRKRLLKEGREFKGR